MFISSRVARQPCYSAAIRGGRVDVNVPFLLSCEHELPARGPRYVHLARVGHRESSEVRIQRGWYGGPLRALRCPRDRENRQSNDAKHRSARGHAATGYGAERRRRNHRCVNHLLNRAGESVAVLRNSLDELAANRSPKRRHRYSQVCLLHDCAGPHQPHQLVFRNERARMFDKDREHVERTT
jgi:hypothetical protein